MSYRFWHYRFYIIDFVRSPPKQGFKDHTKPPHAYAYCQRTRGSQRWTCFSVHLETFRKLYNKLPGQYWRQHCRTCVRLILSHYPTYGMQISHIGQHGLTSVLRVGYCDAISFFSSFRVVQSVGLLTTTIVRFFFSFFLLKFPSHSQQSSPKKCISLHSWKTSNLCLILYKIVKNFL